MWESEVAGLVYECLHRSRSWEDVVYSLGYSVHWVQSPSQEQGCSIGTGIFVNTRRAREPYKVMVHELAELLLDSEWQPPYHYVPTTSHQDHKHHIARLVEAFCFPQEAQ